MVAPTPVSALVHSSTLVTAGVYLLYRFLPHYTHFLLFTGILTTLIAGLSAIVEPDIKKIVALSTLSQLGLIVTCLGLQQRSLAFSHLVLHASFKALLFISVGIIIHSVYGSQSFRKMGTLVSSSWLVGCSFVIRSLSLCGLIFMSGWCSKESLLAAFYSSSTPYLLLVSFYLGFFLTLSYRFRLVYYSASVYKSHVPGSGFSSVSAVAKVPLVILICLSVFQGSWLSPIDNVSCEILSSWVVWFYWGFWCLGATFGMWLRQRVQGITTPLLPLYSTSIGLSSFAAPMSTLLHTENTYLQTAFASSLYRLGLHGSRSHSYHTLAWVTLVALFLLT
jgi:NADH:ubiquinone oxidoreductase subunit 5 (subunit L)/multisubunit Na+/H+ antiporter MnhA subunit